MSAREELARALAAGASRARELLAARLAARRAMDPAGAALVVGRDPELARLLESGTGTAEELLARVDELARADQCIGCATCCRTSSPTLYLDDLRHVYSEGLDKGQLYTLRAGEMGHSPRTGESRQLATELIKVREKDGACTFLRRGRCAVYQHRPLQCRYLQCWSDEHAGRLEGLARLTRAEVYAEDETALALMAEYETKVPAGELTDALLATAGDLSGGQGAVLALMERDQRLRHGITARYGYPPWELELLFGRPAVVVARAHGLAPGLAGGEPVLVRL